jgi:signal transduction histidine kinase
MTAQPPLSILVADDDDGDRRQMRRILRQAGIHCEVTEVADIEQASQACRDRKFDCAIVDYRMPGHDGLYGISSLRELQPDMAIVMVTGQGDEIIASEAIKLGAADYVPKSQLSPGYLQHVLRNALHKMALERKVAEQKSELESFAHVLAHDLKSPLHHIQYLVRFIERDINEGDMQKLKDDCDKIESAAKRMEDLINTLHQYTRTDSRVAFSNVSLQMAVEDCLTALAPYIDAAGAKVAYSDLPMVHGNSALLAQLFQNLVGNGMKYCKAEQPVIHIESSPRDGFHHITVTDNGIGIPAEFRERIFEPFRRLHSADQYEGAGLGLAICRKIVDRHGGDIWCDGGEDGGTVFWITLPEAGVQVQ